MAGKTTTACTHEQYETIIKTLYEGIGDCIQPNPRIATILVIEANVGLRIGDTLSLRRSSFIKTPLRLRSRKRNAFLISIEKSCAVPAVLHH